MASPPLPGISADEDPLVPIGTFARADRITDLPSR